MDFPFKSWYNGLGLKLLGVTIHKTMFYGLKTVFSFIEKYIQIPETVKHITYILTRSIIVYPIESLRHRQIISNKSIKQCFNQQLSNYNYSNFFKGLALDISNKLLQLGFQK